MMHAPLGRAENKAVIEGGFGLRMLHVAAPPFTYRSYVARVNPAVEIGGLESGIMSTAEEVRDYWRRIDAWLEENVPDLRDALNPPATADQIAQAEQTIGATFPLELRAALAIHDGQQQADAAFGQWEPLDLRRIVNRWRKLADLLAKGEIRDRDETDIQTRGPVRPRWWSGAWIPIAADGTGDLLAVDLDPPPGGAPGQVVLFQHDTPYREVVAADFGLWLKQVAELLESGAYVPTPAGDALEPKE